MTWIRYECDSTDADVWEDLADLCGISHHLAFYCYWSMLGRFARQRPDGMIAAVKDGTLERWSGWTGVPGQWVAAVRERCTSDGSGKDPKGTLRGWWRQAKLLQRQQKQNRRPGRSRRTVARDDDAVEPQQGQGRPYPSAATLRLLDGGTPEGNPQKKVIDPRQEICEKSAGNGNGNGGMNHFHSTDADWRAALVAALPEVEDTLTGLCKSHPRPADFLRALRSYGPGGANACGEWVDVAQALMVCAARRGEVTPTGLAFEVVRRREARLNPEPTRQPPPLPEKEPRRPARKLREAEP